MIKKLIFDVDGTLITGVNFVSTIERTLKRLGIYSEEKVKLFLLAISTYEKKYDSYNKKDYCAHIGAYLNEVLDDVFLSTFFDELKTCVPAYNINLKSSVSLFAKRYELALLTNYFKKSQLNRLDTMGIKEFFKECYGEELIKPNVDIYLKACGEYQPSECVMIGDDPYLDIEMAQSLGINTIFVNSKGLDISQFNTIAVNSVEEITVDLIESISVSRNCR